MTEHPSLIVRREPGVSAAVAERMARLWDGAVAVHGRLYLPSQLDALVALDGERWVGLLTFVVEDPGLEIVSLDVEEPRRGIGSLLVTRAVQHAEEGGVRRVWCTTTNDNLPALGFWQARGFRLCALRPDAVASARRLKPALPLTGIGGLPVRDEIDLELLLG